jgi:hypothetical protein
MAKNRPGGPEPVPVRRGAGSSTAAVRGALLLAVVTVLGVWALQKADRGTPGTSVGTTASTIATGGSTVAGATPTDSVSAAPTTVAVAAAAVDRTKIKVLVVNTTTVSKVARNARCDLLPGGWDLLKAIDAKKKSATKAPDLIYVQDEFRGEAEAIAQKLGLVASDVQSFPSAASELPVTALQAKGVDIMVLVGANTAQTYKAKPCTATTPSPAAPVAPLAPAAPPTPAQQNN